MQHVHGVLTFLLFTLAAHAAVASPPSASAIFAADTAERVATLVNSGADLWATNGDGSTPLHVALVNGRAEAALAMIAHGAPASARDVYGRTPQHIAASTGNA